MDQANDDSCVHVWGGCRHIYQDTIRGAGRVTETERKWLATITAPVILGKGTYTKEMVVNGLNPHDAALDAARKLSVYSLRVGTKIIVSPLLSVDHVYFAQYECPNARAKKGLEIGDYGKVIVYQDERKEVART